jgi:DNA-binding response OmpR family regulator
MGNLYREFAKGVYSMRIQQQNSCNPNMKALYFTKAFPKRNDSFKYINEKITKSGIGYVEDKSAKLTPTEFDIINILMQHYGQTVNSGIFLKEIWGYSEDDDVEMVRVHVRHLRSKIEKIAPKNKYITTVYGGGYKLNVTD